MGRRVPTNNTDEPTTTDQDTVASNQYDMATDQEGKATNHAIATDQAIATNQDVTTNQDDMATNQAIATDQVIATSQDITTDQDDMATNQAITTDQDIATNQDITDQDITTSQDYMAPNRNQEDIPTEQNDMATQQDDVTSDQQDIRTDKLTMDKPTPVLEASNKPFTVPRVEAVQNLKKQAECMTKQATARLKPSNTGDNVLLQTPEIDRGRGDPVSLLEIVLDKTAGGFKVGTMQGFMSRKLCCTRQLEASKLEQRQEFCLGNLEETNWR